MAQTQSGTGSQLLTDAFDLLRFGIDRHYDAEIREAVSVNEPTAQHEQNQSGNVQRVGTIDSGGPLGGVGGLPVWAQWLLTGSVLMLSAGLMLKVLGFK